MFSISEGIVFLNVEDSKPWPKKVEYKLRFNPLSTPSTSKVKAKYVPPCLFIIYSSKVKNEEDLIFNEFSLISLVHPVNPVNG